MLNFNGQLKKRTVNLGGGSRGKTRTSILQQTLKEREKREYERLKEKNVTIIQNAIRRYIDLTAFREQQSRQWALTTDLSASVFHFNVFFGYIFKSNPLKHSQLEQMTKGLQRAGTSLLLKTDLDGLFKSIVLSLDAIDIQKSQDIECIGLLMGIAKLISNQPTSTTRFQIIPILSKMVHQLYSIMDCSRILDTINAYSFSEPQNYIEFLSSSIIADLKHLDINYSAIATFQTVELPIDRKLTLLSNLIEKRQVLTEQVIVSIANVISSINVPLTTRTEEQFEYAKANDLGSNKDDPRKYRKIITDELNETISILYTTDFITTASKILEAHNASLLYGSLISLRPSMKSSLIIHLIPRTFEPLLRSVLSNPTFNKFLEMPESFVFSITTELIDDIFINGAEFLLFDLSIFLQLFQYRLITSNDFEIFNGYNLTVEKFEKIAIFLKRFVFNIIWSNNKIFNRVENRSKFLELKRLSIKVLNQVYLKNSRIAALDQNIWLIDTLDMSQIVALIVRYEDQKTDGEDDDYESDDSNPEEATEIPGNYIPGIDAAGQARLEIFKKTPFFISFSKRVEIFQLLVEMDREKSTQMSGALFNPFGDFAYRGKTARIRREHLLEDAYENFNGIGAGLKNKLEIVFLNEHGPELGVDGGGITKEFLSSVVQDAIKAELMIGNSQNELYPNPEIGIKYQYRVDTEEQMKKLNYTKFFGKIVGKCLYEKVLVDMSFASFFLMKLNSSFKNSFDDLKSMDEDLHSSLVKLLQMSPEELEGLQLTFAVDEKLSDTKTISVELIPNGAVTAVTVSNRLKFVHEMSNYKLNKLMNLQSNYFLSGLYTMISKDWLRLFNPYELQRLISGENEINVEDLRKHTVYGNGFTEDSKTIKYLWEVVNDMSSKDKVQFVKFVTSVPRAPLLGFKALNPLFGVVNSGDSTDRLPTSGTCFNLLRIPDYEDKALLKEKLLYAINAEARFDLA